jgi:hypothetical protein
MDAFMAVFSHSLEENAPQKGIELGFGSACTGDAQGQSLQGLPWVGGPIGHFQTFDDAVHLVCVLEQLRQTTGRQTW